MASRRFGVLAEDATDVGVLRVLIQRRLGGGAKVLGRAGKGCARVRSKAQSWMAQFSAAGIREVVIVHDCDNRAREQQLRRELEAIDVPQGIERHICIPVEEMEAWFWADPRVVREIGRGKGNASLSPHLIQGPKEALIRLSRDANKRPRYTTQENERLAKMLDMELCARCCPSFRDLLDFLRRR